MLGPLLQTREAEDVLLVQIIDCVRVSEQNSSSMSGNETNDSAIITKGDENTASEDDTSSVTKSSFTSNSNGETTEYSRKAESSATCIESGFIRTNRGDLFVETAKILYALYGLDDGEESTSDGIIRASIDMEMLCNLLCAVILAPIDNSHSDSSKIKEMDMQRLCRRHSLQLAMLSLDLQPAGAKVLEVDKLEMENEVPLFLIQLMSRGGIMVLCNILDEFFKLLDLAVLQGEDIRTVAGGTPAVVLSPILVLLTRVATSSMEGRAELKAIIFPNSWEEDLSEDDNQKMDPTDIPEGSLRSNLIGLMTSLDSVLKRYCAELLYALCEEGTGEFVGRTGFGNAIALMQIKGLI